MSGAGGDGGLGHCRRHLAAALLGVLLAGCDSVPQRPLPAGIRQPPAGDLQLVEARQAPQRHLGARVRWGGTVIEIAREDGGSTRVVILERRLDGDGRPLAGSASDGRFVIRAAAAVDPAIYRRGSEITVAGTLDGVVLGRVGNDTVPLPVVRVHDFHRWPARAEGPYGPYGDPYYDGYYYPYHGPYYYPGAGYPYHPYRTYGYPPVYGPRWRFGLGLGYAR